MADESHKVFTVVESVIFYHADPESGTSKFAGPKERVRIGLRDSLKILSVFLKYVTSFLQNQRKVHKMWPWWKLGCQDLVRDGGTTSLRRYKLSTINLISWIINWSLPTKTSMLIFMLVWQSKWKICTLFLISRINAPHLSTTPIIWETLFMKASKGSQAEQPIISLTQHPI